MGTPNYERLDSKFTGVRTEDARINKTPEFLPFVVQLLELALGFESSVGLRLLAFCLHAAFDGGSHLVVVRLSSGLRHSIFKESLDTAMHSAGGEVEWIADAPDTLRVDGSSQVVGVHRRPCVSRHTRSSAFRRFCCHRKRTRAKNNSNPTSPNPKRELLPHSSATPRHDGHP